MRHNFTARGGILMTVVTILSTILLLTGSSRISRVAASIPPSRPITRIGHHHHHDHPLRQYGHHDHHGSSNTTTLNHTFTFSNDCAQPIWVAALPNPGHATILGGGWKIDPNASSEVQIPNGWQGRFWGRTNCSFSPSGTCDPPGAPCCSTGNCVDIYGAFGLGCIGAALPPSSLLEVALDNPSYYGPYDVYDISLVDGWNVVMTMEPVNGSYNPSADKGILSPWCNKTGCDVLPSCPPEYVREGVPGACWSPCQLALKMNHSSALINQVCCICDINHQSCNCGNSNDQNSSHFGCCKGGFGCTPIHEPPYANDTVCDPWAASSSRRWPDPALEFINAIEEVCHNVYTWQFDDKAATNLCRKTDGVVDYIVRFHD